MIFFQTCLPFKTNPGLYHRVSSTACKTWRAVSPEAIDYGAQWPPVSRAGLRAVTHLSPLSSDNVTPELGGQK